MSVAFQAWGISLFVRCNPGRSRGANPDHQVPAGILFSAALVATACTDTQEQQQNAQFDTINHLEITSCLGSGSDQLRLIYHKTL